MPSAPQIFRARMRGMAYRFVLTSAIIVVLAVVYVAYLTLAGM